MKKLTTQQVRDLLNQVYHEEISFSRMVEILNEMVSEAEKKCVEDIPKPKFKVGDKVQIKYGISSKTHHNISLMFTEEMEELIGTTMTVAGYDRNGYVKCEGMYWVFLEDWLEPYVEDIPKRKFQKGDKVRIKHGISSKTMHGQYPVFQPFMDYFIGTIMTVNRYEDTHGFVICNESDWRFNEEWLEPYTDELKEGDLAIFWDDSKEYATIRFYDRPVKDYTPLQHKDNIGFRWKNAIKFESKEQYEKLIKGEI